MGLCGYGKAPPPRWSIGLWCATAAKSSIAVSMAPGDSASTRGSIVGFGLEIAPSVGLSIGNVRGCMEDICGVNLGDRSVEWLRDGCSWGRSLLSLIPW